MKNSLFIVAQAATRPPSLSGNRGLSELTFLHPGDRITAHVCGEIITGIIQLPHPEVLFGAAQRGAEFSYGDQIWRIEFLADDGQLICCHRDQCEAAGGAA